MLTLKTFCISSCVGSLFKISLKAFTNNNSKAITPYKPVKHAPYYNPPNTNPTIQNTNPTIQNTNQTIQRGGFLSGFGFGMGLISAKKLFDKDDNNECINYKLCKQLENPNECFSKMDQKEYIKCKSKEN